jgi:hypothetical protein
MNFTMRASRHLLWLAAGVLSVANCFAQAPLPPLAQAASTGKEPALFAPGRSPVESFRELLAMEPATRLKAIDEVVERNRREDASVPVPPGASLPAVPTAQLATAAAHQRRFLLGKLAEYDALSPEERELRLRVTELRWQLVPMMHGNQVDRTQRLSKLPPADRKLVEERLRDWDKLPADLRRDILANEVTIQHYLRLESSTPEQRKAMLEALPAERRKKLETDLAAWNGQSLDRRQKMLVSFHRFFELNEHEKELTLGKLSEAERRQMAQTLQQFDQLPVQQRLVCIRSFLKFSSMKPEQQMEFLTNAERWEKMTPGERETWRHLVTQLPPLPPGFDDPPMPPGLGFPPPLPFPSLTKSR